jgi:hypothetical protein
MPYGKAKPNDPVKASWNYRVLMHRDDPDEIVLGLHEVHYNDGKIVGWTEEPIIVGDTVEELLRVLARMAGAVVSGKDILYADKLPGAAPDPSTR